MMITIIHYKGTLFVPARPVNKSRRPSKQVLRREYWNYEISKTEPCITFELIWLISHTNYISMVILYLLQNETPEGIIMIYLAHPATTLKSKIKSILPYILAAPIIGIIFLWIRARFSNYVFLASKFVRFGDDSPWYHMLTLNILLENYLFYPESCLLVGMKRVV